MPSPNPKNPEDPNPELQTVAAAFITSPGADCHGGPGLFAEIRKKV